MKKFWIILLVVALLCGAIAAGGYYYFHANYYLVNGEALPKNQTQLDLRGAELPPLEELTQLTQLQQLDLRDTGLTAEQYQLLCQQLPDCEILWSVPFQGKQYPNETALLYVTQLSESDIAQLAYFPKLTQIDALDCQDYAALQTLQDRYPHLDIRYQIAVAGQNLERTATELTLQDPDLSELEAILPYLPELQTVTLTGTLPANEEVHKLQLAYPDVCFVWNFTLCGVEVTTQDTLVDLSNIPMESVQEVESSLPYFNNLERVIMCDCGISNEEMDALGKRNPETRFVWTVSIGPNVRLRTDATYFMPYQYGAHLNDSHTENLKYCIDLICIDLGHMNVSDVSFLRYMPHMKYLLIAISPVADISPLAGLQELEYAELFYSNIRDYTPLLTCPNLRDLNICYATPPDCSVLKQLTWLENLYIKEWEPITYIDELREALPNTNIVYRSYESPSSTADGWRKLPRYYAMRDLLGMPYFTG